MDRLLRTPEVAERLGLSVEAFYRRRRSLEAAGFPPPKPPFKSRWADSAVSAWISAGTAPSLAASPAAVPSAPSDDDADAWTALLKQRARQMP